LSTDDSVTAAKLAAQEHNVVLGRKLNYSLHQAPKTRHEGSGDPPLIRECSTAHSAVALPNSS